jgi:hypothetical protein
VTAYERSCENVTGPIARTISHAGLRAVREELDPAGREVFDRAYSATYGPAREIVAEIYDEVADGTELRSVVLAERRLGAREMSGIGGSPMWAVGAEVRARRAERALPVDPFTAGVFVATMTAQVDEFAERGHPWSEIVNESVIEAVDSLLPYMHARDVAYMVDNCSRTARLGARRWGPRFQAACQVPVTASQVLAGGAGVPYMCTLTVWASAAQQVKMMRVRSQPPPRTGVAKPVISTLRPLMASSLSCWTRVVKSVRVIGRGEVAGSAANRFCCLTASLPAWEAV